jgi:predicted lipoprotein with Yx(FWY)xxD motif
VAAKLGLPAALIAVLALAGIAFAASRPTVIYTGKVQFQSGKTVTALKNGRGDPLYMSTHDGRDKSKCTGNCALTFKPVTTTKSVVAKSGSGLNSKLLRTIKTGSKLQVTYNHHPLYYAPTDLGGPLALQEGCNKYGGVWYVLDKHGNAIKPTGPGCQSY